MEVPTTCGAWRAQLAVGENSERTILNNIESEAGIADIVSREFFETLQAKGTPISPEEAWSNAIAVVAENYENLTLRGREIPVNLFVRILRVDPLDSLQFRAPVLYEEETMAIYGLNEQTQLHRLPSALIEEFLNKYDGPIHLGNMLGIVWVTDSEGADLIAPGELVDRLGLADFLEEKFCLYFIYERTYLECSLHVPSVLDAIDHKGFQTTDLDSECGRTKPCSEGFEDMWEAVHRSCEIGNYSWELKELG